MAGRVDVCLWYPNPRVGGGLSEEAPVAPAPEKKERHDWDRDLYVAPILSWASYHPAILGIDISFGAAAGINYKQKKLGPKLKGYSPCSSVAPSRGSLPLTRPFAGAFVGLAFGPVALTVGPDVFTSESSYGCGDGQSNGGNCVHLDSVVGVGVPLMLTGDILGPRLRGRHPILVCFRKSTGCG